MSLSFATNRLCPVALLLTLSCSTGSKIDSGGTLHLPALQSYTFYVDPDVDADGQLAVAEAAKQWTEYTSVQITVLPGPELCFEPGCFAIYEVPFTAFDTLTDGTYIGETIPFFIFVAQGLDYDALQDTMIHEMGHALGGYHPCTSPCDDYAVMNPTYLSGADHVACADVDQYDSERPQSDAGAPLECTDVPGPLDESADGGPL